MKKVVFTLAVLVVLVVLLGADIRRDEATFAVPSLPRERCYGYTIIEFGKGIDCNGDTVKLVKVNGIQQMLKPVALPEASKNLADG
jgi:hypothetical protein